MVEIKLKTKDACSVPQGLAYGCTLSGAFAVLDQIVDSVCIVHGPVGCAHLNLAGHRSMAFRGEKITRGTAPPSSPHPFDSAQDRPSQPSPLSARVFSTRLGEDEVIFGGEEPLRKAIREVDRRFHPSLITVISSCVSSIIGDHVEGVIGELQGEIGAQLLWVESDGFISGGFDLGVNQAYRALIEKLVEPPRTREREGVNLLGEKALALEVEVNFREIERLLEQLGVKVRTRFVRRATTEGIRGMARAALNLICSHETGLYPASLLRERYDMPFLTADFPVGRGEAREWLQGLGQLLGREREAEETARREEEDFLRGLSPLKGVLAGKRVVVNTVDRDIVWLTDLIRLGEMELLQVNVMQILRAPTGPFPANLGPIDPSIPVRPARDLDEVAAEVARLHPDLCLGGYRIPLELEGTVFQPIPMVPAVGYRGPLELATRWQRALKVPYREGWRRGRSYVDALLR